MTTRSKDHHHILITRAVGVGGKRGEIQFYGENGLPLRARSVDEQQIWIEGTESRKISCVLPHGTGGNQDHGLGGEKLLPLGENRTASSSQEAREAVSGRDRGRGDGGFRVDGRRGRKRGEAILMAAVVAMEEDPAPLPHQGASPGVPEAREGPRPEESVDPLLDLGRGDRSSRASHPLLHGGDERESERERGGKTGRRKKRNLFENRLERERESVAERIYS